MSKGVIGDPAVDAALVDATRDAATLVRTLAETMRTEIRNLDEASEDRVRDSVYNLKRAVLDVDYIVSEHSRALLRKAIGGKGCRCE